MLYFSVDVDLGVRLIPEAKEEDFLHDFDSRLLRTDGTKVEAMFQNSDDTIIWKTAVAGMDC